MRLGRGSIRERNVASWNRPALVEWMPICEREGGCILPRGPSKEYLAIVLADGRFVLAIGCTVGQEWLRLAPGLWWVHLERKCNCDESSRSVEYVLSSGPCLVGRLLLIYWRDTTLTFSQDRILVVRGNKNKIGVSKSKVGELVRKASGLDTQLHDSVFSKGVASTRTNSWCSKTHFDYG